MNNYKIYLSIVVIFNYLVLKVLADNNYYMIGIKINSKNIKYEEANEEIQNEFDQFINERMNNIYNIIVDNKETYALKNGTIDKKLNELKKISKIRKRNLNENTITKIEFINSNAIILKKKSNKSKENPVSIKSKKSIEYIQLDSSLINESKEHYINTNSKENSKENIEYIQLNSDLVSHLFPLSDKYLIQAYLSDKIVDKVKELPNIEYIDKVVKSKEYRSINYDDNDFNAYYNEKDILKETQWEGLEVQKNKFDFNLSFTHLSIISQGKYKKNTNTTYDNNYYYPSSAGKGIDIYIIEPGINLSLSKDDFDTYEGERTMTCDGIFNNGKYRSAPNLEYCSFLNYNHGSLVTIAAVGKIHGVAKKANLHLLRTSYAINDEALALKYIEENAKPGKTIINISRGNENYYSITFEEQIKNMVEKGFIIFVASGNENMNACNNYHYSSYPGVISVGAINNEINETFGNMELMYERANYTNYGNCVEFFAPGTVKITDYPSNKIKIYDIGTSYSSPIVAGVAATIMSDNPNEKFNYKIMKQKLIELSLKNVIKGIDTDTPNRLINNGKTSISQPPRCDDPSGRYQCQDECCSKFGQCVDSHSSDEKIDALCLIENQCMPEFGYCKSTNITINKSKTSTTTTPTTKKSTTTTTKKSTTTTTKKSTTTTTKKSTTTTKKSTTTTKKSTTTTKRSTTTTTKRSTTTTTKKLTTTTKKSTTTTKKSTTTTKKSTTTTKKSTTTTKKSTTTTKRSTTTTTKRSTTTTTKKLTTTTSKKSTTTTTKSTNTTSILSIPTVNTKIVYIQSLNNKRCVYAHEITTYKLRYSSTCKDDPNYLWEIPESGSGIWRNIGTKNYVSFNGSNLITTTDKSLAVKIGDMNKSVVANSIWYDNPDFKNKCCTERNGKLDLKKCNVNNKKQRWIAIDRI